MDRLSSVTGQTQSSVMYSANGNITNKSDAGGYVYDQAKTNAVTQILNNTGTIPSTLDSIAYTDFNMTSSVTEAPYEILYTYCPGNQRIKSVLKNDGSMIKTKYYSIGYEKEITGSTERQIHYISSPFGLVAVLIKQGETTSTYYTETDHLGSIIALLNPDGSYSEQYSYDAWGRRRNPTDWTYINVPVATLLDRGYTGHEHLDLFGLINMNGRMYDPVLGRFAGVDPIIQSMDNSQSFNGYSYCLNNPLKYSDPSGLKYRPYSFENDFQSNYVESWQQYQELMNQGGNGAPSYSYNAKTNTYTNDKTGGRVPYNEVFYNYIVPNSSKDPQDIIDLLNRFNATGGLGPPTDGNNQITQSTDHCGVNAWVLFPNRFEAELYLKDNSNCDKEKFFYINIDKTVLVGPWNDADRTHTSPRYLLEFDNGNIIFNGESHRVEYFVHTHPDHYTPGFPNDYKVHNYFNYWNISTLIYYRENYYYYDNNNTYHFVP